jgi:signal transduction histidine kinase
VRRRLRELAEIVLPVVPSTYFEYKQGGRRTRATIMLLYIVVVYAAFYPLDLVVYPQHALFFGLMRAGVVAVAAMGLVGLRGTSSFPWHVARFAFWLGTLSVEIMCVSTEGFSSRYIIGLLVCFVGGSTIELFTPKELTAGIVGIFGLHMVLNSLFGKTPLPGEVASGIFFIGGGGLLNCVPAFLLEHQSRRIYLAQMELSTKNAALAKAQGSQREFFNKITHELRTPVNSISGFADLVLTGEKLTDAGVRKMELIRLSATRLQALINDILDLARHEASGLAVVPEPVDVPELIRELKETAQALVGARPVSLDFSCQVAQTPVTDGKRLRQILLNLTTNAVKFTMEGHVRVKAAQDSSGAKVQFTIEDTGIGIPKDKQAALFSAFGQARSSDQRIGTGLGLNIVDQFARLLQGNVAFESEEGVGSRFTLEVPMQYREGSP